MVKPKQVSLIWIKGKGDNMEKGKTYGEAVSRLEEIVASLERGGKGAWWDSSVIRRRCGFIETVSRGFEICWRKIEWVKARRYWRTNIQRLDNNKNKYGKG